MPADIRIPLGIRISADIRIPVGIRMLPGIRMSARGIRISGYRPISGYPPVTRIRQNPDATGAWRTDIRIRIRHGYPDFRIRLRALFTTLTCGFRVHRAGSKLKIYFES